MKKKCSKCSHETESYNLNSRDECSSCHRRRESEEEDSTRLRNLAMGDMFNTGIPGGTDLDITTPW